MSFCLSQRGHEHLIVERQQVAQSWRSERWDSLTFQFPNWSLQLPGFPFQGNDPEKFSSREEVVRFIEDYAAFTRAPVRTGVMVRRVRMGQSQYRFAVETDRGTLRVSNIVVATGPYQKPIVPDVLKAAVGNCFQLHSSAYRNPEQLPPGATLIIGSGASGCQIAEELAGSDRRTYLASGAHRPVPRRYRGRDFIFWEFSTGEYDCPVEQRRPGRSATLLTGVDGGHDLDLRFLARQGVTLLGHAEGGANGKLSLAADLDSIIARGDALFEEFLVTADRYADAADLGLPQDKEYNDKSRRDPVAIRRDTTLDLRKEGIKSVIWAIGFDIEFPWLELPAFDDGHQPRHRRGVADLPGLYFLGLPWLSKRKSTLLAGVGEDAEFIAERICHLPI
jgi:putative flavoprotein involved in K+ transport